MVSVLLRYLILSLYLLSIQFIILPSFSLLLFIGVVYYPSRALSLRSVVVVFVIVSSLPGSFGLLPSGLVVYWTSLLGMAVEAELMRFVDWLAK